MVVLDGSPASQDPHQAHINKMNKKLVHHRAIVRPIPELLEWDAGGTAYFQVAKVTQDT